MWNGNLKRNELDKITSHLAIPKNQRKTTEGKTSPEGKEISSRKIGNIKGKFNQRSAQ